METLERAVLDNYYFSRTISFVPPEAEGNEWVQWNLEKETSSKAYALRFEHPLCISMEKQIDALEIT